MCPLFDNGFEICQEMGHWHLCIKRQLSVRHYHCIMDRHGCICVMYRYLVTTYLTYLCTSCSFVIWTTVAFFIFTIVCFSTPHTSYCSQYIIFVADNWTKTHRVYFMAVVAVSAFILSTVLCVCVFLWLCIWPVACIWQTCTCWA